MGKGPAREEMLKEIGAAVFDFDGTLAVLNIDFPAMRRAVLELAEDSGIPPEILDGLFVLETIEAGRHWLAAKFPGRAESFHRGAMALISSIEIRAARNGALLDGTRELLAGMKERGVRRGIITRNCGEAVIRIFPDLIGYCDVFLPREAVFNIKPHPGHLLESLARMDVAPGRAIMVGDHPMDIRTGREAGTRTVGVLTGSSRREDLIQAGADLVVPSAAALLPLLR